MTKPEKNTHRFLFFLSILNDYFRSVFCCSAPIEGGVGGSLRMNMKTNANAMAAATSYPAYNLNIYPFASLAEDS